MFTIGSPRNAWAEVKSAIRRYGPIPRHIWSFEEEEELAASKSHFEQPTPTLALSRLQHVSSFKDAINQAKLLNFTMENLHCLFLVYRLKYDNFSSIDVSIISLDAEKATIQWFLERNISEQLRFLQSTETWTGLEAIAGGLFQACVIKKWKRDQKIELELHKLSQGDQTNSNLRVQQQPTDKPELRLFTFRTEQPVNNYRPPEKFEPNCLYYKGVRDANMALADAILLKDNICGLLQITRKKVHEIAISPIAMQKFGPSSPVKIYYILVTPDWRDEVEISYRTVQRICEKAGNPNISFYTAGVSFGRGDLE